MIPNPDPKRRSVAGPGTRGTPGTFAPSVVPKEKVALLTSDEAMRPMIWISNVAVPVMNGL